MKAEVEEINNSIEYPIPVNSDSASSSKRLEEVKILPSEPERSESFKYEGGEETKNYDDSKDVTSKHVLPPINFNSGKAFNGDLEENIYNLNSAVTSQTRGLLRKEEPPKKESISEKDNEDDYSVYEVQSDGKDSNDGLKENIGLMESEARSGENVKTMLIFIILFAVLIFSAGICCVLAFNFSSANAGWCILILIIVTVIDILILRNLW